MAQARLQGIFTPNLIPYTADGGINESELRRYADWLIERGVHGLYPNGSTGEFTRFTPEERRRIVAILADQVRGRVPILAGAAEANVKETLKACEYYASLGIRAVAIVAPFYYKLSPASVYAYFKEIGRNTPIDVTLYNIPLFATGWDAALMPMLLIGCDGGTNASSGVVPELTRKLYDLTKSYQIDAARAVQYDLVKLFDTMIYSAEFPEGFRAAVELRGFKMGHGRQPLSDKQQTDIGSLSRELQCMLSNHGFTDQPVGGCPLSEPGANPAEVSAIVQQVVAELHRRGLM